MKYVENQQVCSDCGEEMIKTETAFTVDFNCDVGVIRKVPTLLCPECETEWIEGNSRKNRDDRGL